jgi:ankyrin repeat protein
VGIGRVVGAVIGVVLSALGVVGSGLPSSAATTAASRFPDPAVAELVRAAAAGDEAEVRRLRESGVDIETRGWAGFTPFLALVHAGHGRGVRTVLAAGADPTAAGANGSTAVHVAASRPDVRMLRMLLDQGFDPSSPNAVTGGSPLRPALHSHREDTVALLLDRGTDIDLADRTGHTPLHYAAMINRTGVVRDLLAAGADPTARTVTGATFQRYFFKTPDRILLGSVKRDRRAVEAWLRERDIPVER